MPPPPVPLLIAALAILVAGCTSPAGTRETGLVFVVSEPSGAEIYFDNEYRGTTPATIAQVSAGTHTIELRMNEYEPWKTTVTVAEGENATMTAHLVRLPVTLAPVTIFPTAHPLAAEAKPVIYVDGYWTFVPGRESLENPVPLIVHTEAFNTGNATARHVEVPVNFWYHGHMVCWDTLYLGTLPAAGHDAKDTMVSCTLPSGFTGPDLVLRFGEADVGGGVEGD